jgi:hypothetical protein
MYLQNYFETYLSKLIGLDHKMYSVGMLLDTLQD